MTRSTCTSSVILLALISLCYCDSSDVERQCQPHHYEELESALVSEKENLYKLRHLFFRTQNMFSIEPDKIGFRICLKGNGVQDLNVTADPCKLLPTQCWYLAWSSSLLYGMITPGDFDPIFGRNIHEIATEDWSDIDSDDSTFYLYTWLKNDSVFCDTQYPHRFQNALIRLASWVRSILYHYFASIC